jgi:nucleoside-diphosphate-sugar epimerase
LVTGANGFVGRHLVPILAENGYRVIATSRQQRPNDGHPEKNNAKRIIIWRQLSSDSVDQDWRDACEKAEIVVHLAARVHVMHEEKRTALPAHLETNTEFTKRIANIAQGQGVKRFVFVSTIKVLGERTLDRPFDSTSRGRPQDPYSESKHLAEITLRQICQSRPMEYVIVRPTLIIGDGASGNLDRLIRWIASGIPLPLGGIENGRSLLSVETLCQILLRVLDNPNVANKTLLAAEPGAMSTPEIVEALAHGYGRAVRLFSMPPVLIRLLKIAPVIGNSVSRLSESLVVDSSQTYAYLDWKPTVSISDRLQAVGRRFRDGA